MFIIINFHMHGAKDGLTVTRTPKVENRKLRAGRIHGCLPLKGNCPHQNQLCMSPSKRVHSRLACMDASPSKSIVMAHAYPHLRSKANCHGACIFMEASPSKPMAPHQNQLCMSPSKRVHSRLACIDANLSLCRRNTSRRPGVPWTML